MIDITGLREDKRPQSSRIVHALLDRLEAAEKERDDVARQLVQSEQGKRKISEECDALRAKIEAMEQQKPVGTLHDDGYFVWSVPSPYESNYAGWKMKLYALPGAQAQPAQKAVAYLDLGVGGYVDVGTDLTDEALAALPKGRHMLGIVGTYGVDGYVPAQPAPIEMSITTGALSEMFLRLDGHNKAQPGYEWRKGWNDAIRQAMDYAQPAPSVPDGYKLVPIVSTIEMDNAGADHCDGYWITAQAVWDAMLAAAPEAKP